MCRFQTIEWVDDEKLWKLEEKIFTVFKKIILDKDLSNSDRDRIDNLARELNSEFKKIVISAEKDQNSYCVESWDIIQDVECNRNIGATDNDLSVIIADWIQSRFPGIPENKKIDELTWMLIENILGNLDQSEEQRLVESLEWYSKK
jgi:hypothetical protein